MWSNCSGCIQEKELVARCKWSPGYFFYNGHSKENGKLLYKDKIKYRKIGAECKVITVV